MVLGEADRVVAQGVAGFGELGEVGEHVLVELGTVAGHAGFDVLARADGGKEEETDLHGGS